MSQPTGRHAARQGRVVRRLAAGVAVGTVVAVLVTLVVVRGGAAPTAGGAPVVEPTPEPVAQAPRPALAATAPRTGSVAPESPQRTVLPSGTVVPVVAVTTTPDGKLDVPSDVDVAGWWRGGSRIGDPFGSVLVSAHVDSERKGLGPYAELLGVRRGQTVVLTSDTLRQEYVVSSLRLLAKGPLSAHPWVYSPTGAHRLVMVTCAGPFDPSRGGYQNLAVVTATAVGEPTPRSE
ncbi:class F sortase [Mycobacterium cookii]|uniref:Class F sortase n=1 Tax=Nocardioides furvisabuli TaxID=375542 RepID=A0ABN2XAJ5_9ACTN|nr:class F sortase [Nocardioides furvisabuli]